MDQTQAPPAVNPADAQNAMLLQMLQQSAAQQQQPAMDTSQALGQGMLSQMGGPPNQQQMQGMGNPQSGALASQGATQAGAPNPVLQALFANPPPTGP